MRLILFLSLGLFAISCAKDSDLSKEQKKDYLVHGKSIAILSQKALGAQLIKQIQHDGTEQALVFCNINAIRITDSLSKSNKASIKRLSDQNRNPQNKADQEALNYILTSKNKLLNKEELEPYFQNEKDSVRMLFPITTNGLCLQCHGDVNREIEEKTLEKIDLLYPNDLAKGYSINELRGVWSIRIAKE